MSEVHTPPTAAPWFWSGTSLMASRKTHSVHVLVTKDAPLAPSEADKDFIVRAVNAHEAMLAALKECLGLAEIAETLTGCRSDDDYVAGIKAQIEAAIAKAEPSENHHG